MSADADDRAGGSGACPGECGLCASTPPWVLFEQWADETRRRILAELHRASDRPLRFSELRARTQTRDSSRFNYHLTRLVGTFVNRTEAGYDLTLSERKPTPSG